MSEVQTQASIPPVPTGENSQRTLDLLLEEEKSLTGILQGPETPGRTQAMVELIVNHARTAELLIRLWRLQAAERAL